MGRMSEEVRAGQLLVSSAEMTDPHFVRTVVLVLNLDADGALGVVLNRPTQTPVEAVVEGWEPLVTTPAVLFEGGPVEPEAMLAVGRPREGSLPADAWQPMAAGHGLIDLNLSPFAYADTLVDLRIYAGYAGWGPGQLEGEVEEGAWHVLDPLEEELAHVDPLDLWRVLLRRQSGDLQRLSTRPADVTQN